MSINKCTKPKIRIIIVTYNGAQFIAHCINSIQQQTYPKECYSIIIVDNASLDTTVDIVECLKKKDDNIMFIKNNKNSGFGVGNNIGIRKTYDVDYIVLLNQDSWVEPDWLEHLVNSMEKKPHAGCCGAAEHPYKETLSMPKKQKDSTKAGCWMGAGSVILRKEAVDKIGLFDEIYFMYGEDIDLTWRLQLEGYTIIKNNNAIWHHYGRKRNDETIGWRVYYAWRNRTFLLIKFGSRKQVYASLWKYFHYLTLGKREKKEEKNSETAQKENEQKNNRQDSLLVKYKARVRKLLFSAMVCIAIIYHLPLLLQRRRQMKRQGIDYKRTDLWIQETDMQLYGV